MRQELVRGTLAAAGHRAPGGAEAEGMSGWGWFWIVVVWMTLVLAVGAWLVHMMNSGGCCG
jgi:hypothetical protein